MSRLSIAVSVVFAAVLGVFVVSWTRAHQKPALEATSDPEDRAPAPVVSVPRRTVALPEVTPAPAPLPPRRARAEAPRDDAPSYEETLFVMKQKFEALPRDPSAEARNEGVLRSILSKTAPDHALPIESFQCRGQSCRVVFAFADVEQAQATLNVLPSDEDWNRSGMAFNAMPDDPHQPTCSRFTVYFTSASS